MTDDVHLRQAANLRKVTIPGHHKAKIKTPCCVLVEYTGLKMLAMTSSLMIQTFIKNNARSCLSVVAVKLQTLKVPVN